MTEREGQQKVTIGSITTNIVGTPIYMAPETVSDGQEVGFESDVYSLRNF